MNPMDAFNDPRHRESEDLVFRAERFERAGRIADARRLYGQAAGPELELARAQHAPALRSVFALSAVTCLVRAAEWSSAKRAAYEFLARPDALTVEVCAALEDLVDDAQRGEARAEWLDGAPLEIHLEGGMILHGASPSRLVQERVEITEALLMRLADFKTGSRFRRAGRSRAASAFELYEERAKAASYGIRLFIAAARQAPIPGVDVTPREIVDLLLDLAATASSDGAAGVRASVPDAHYANAFIRAFRDLAPDGAAVGAVSFRAPLFGQRRPPVRFTPDSRQALSRALLHGPATDAQEIVGTLKVVRLHPPRRIAILAEDGGVHTLHLPDGDHDDTIGPKLNRRVRVFVRRRTRQDGVVEARVEDVVLLEEPSAAMPP